MWRPIGDKPPEIAQLKADGIRPSEIAIRLGIGRASVYRVVNERDARGRVCCVTIRRRASIGRAMLHRDGLLRQWRSKSCEADHEGRIMFTSIRKYNVRRGSAEELARRVREGFVPMMRQMQGFRGYYLLDGGPDVLITISMFDSADAAFASNEKAADWVRNNVLEFTKGMPEVMIGNALIAEVK